jgi:hypothetical protein
MAKLEQAWKRFAEAERSVRLLDEELVPRAEQALRIFSEEYSTGRPV